mgnify:CR=1 FL=1|tara:strand:+ start:1342 stop:1611 length:270 start_codon:yes stop_codon:yes gene_type:complete
MFINETGLIGLIITTATNNITGSLFLTFFLMLFLFITFGLMFRMPLELSFVLLMPLLIVITAFYSNFLIIYGLALIALALIFSMRLFME